MILEYSTERGDAPEGLAPLLEATARACVEAEGLTVPVYASLQLIGDEEIHVVNRETRGVDRPTDVLSFPTVSYPQGTARDNERRVRREYDPEMGASCLGDILVSLPRARAQAEEYGHTLKRELCYLTAHAMFHLMGYDHETEEERACMRAMEEKALRLLAPREEEMLMDDQALYDLACSMQDRSYCPYSNFHVSAALLCEDGRVFTGVNIENSSYGATICAERAAVCAAVTQGARRFTKIAIVGSTADAWPCGICRQVLAEFAAPGMEVIVGTAGKPWRKALLRDLLPEYFGPGDLGVEV